MLKMSTHSFRVEMVTDATNLSHYRETFNALAENTPQGTIFQTYEWITTWLKHFWPQKPIVFCFVMNQHKPVAMVPLLNDKQGELWCPKTLVSPINPHANRIGLLGSHESATVLSTVFDHLRDRHKRIRLALKCTPQHQADALLDSEAFSPSLMHTLAFQRREAPVVRIETGWETYLSSRSRHLRRELRRKHNKIEKAGAVEFKAFTAPADCEAAMADVFEIEKNSWKEAAGTSFTAEEGLVDFYGGFARRAAEKGWLRLYLLYLNGQPLAHIYGAVYQNTYWAIKTSYHQKFRHLSPGVVIFERALRDVFEMNLAVFDFLGEADRWKSELKNDSVENVDLCVFGPGDAKCGCCMLYQAHLKPWLKDHMPWVVSTRDRIQDAWRTVVKK